MSGNGGCDVADADDESESVTRTSKDQRNEELQVFWSYISNMLINFESLPLDRIYTMLKMFAMAPGGGEGGGGGSGGAGECDIEEVRGFLDRKVRAHELVFSGGQYRLPKS
jgi:anaphase-promoting complex subunit 2